MPEGIVDLLEMIEIRHDDAQRRVVALRPTQCGLEGMQCIRVVLQIGQSIRHRQFAQALGLVALVRQRRGQVRQARGTVALDRQRDIERRDLQHEPSQFVTGFRAATDQILQFSKRTLVETLRNAQRLVHGANALAIRKIGRTLKTDTKTSQVATLRLLQARQVGMLSNNAPELLDTLQVGTEAIDEGVQVRPDDEILQLHPERLRMGTIELQQSEPLRNGCGAEITSRYRG